LTAVGDLEQLFTEAGLAVPPVPAPLAESLELRDEWLFATRDVDRMDTYFLMPYIEEALASTVDDYVAITHGGHGINSWSLNYLLVRSPLVVMTQVGWGGGYMDEARQTTRWAEEMSEVSALLDAMNGVSEGDLGGRLVVAYSDFRDLARWGPVAAGTTGSIDGLPQASEAGPFVDARTWLNQHARN